MKWWPKTLLLLGNIEPKSYANYGIEKKDLVQARK